MKYNCNIPFNVFAMQLLIVYRNLAVEQYQSRSRSRISPTTTSHSITKECQRFRPEKLHTEAEPCFVGNVKTRVSVNVGDTVEFRCFIYNVNFSKTLISWWKDDEMQETSLGLETHNKRFRLPRRFKEDWSLLIDNVETRDAGNYSCQINFDNVIEKLFALQVIEKPVPNVSSNQFFWPKSNPPVEATVTSKSVPSQPKDRKLKNVFYNDVSLNDGASSQGVQSRMTPQRQSSKAILSISYYTSLLIPMFISAYV